MGTFINPEINDLVEKQIDSVKSRIDNPFYHFNTQKPYPVTYYNINKEQSTFDDPTGLNYDSVGEFSSIKYNKINHFIIYGMDRMEITINTGDIGGEAEPIGFNAIIAPNTICAYPGDMLIVHEDEGNSYIFKVQDAQSDTLENGANVWKIECQIWYSGDRNRLEQNVVEEYEYIVNNIGTSYSPVLKSNDYMMVKELDDKLHKLKTFYKSVFYSDRVQSFIFLDKNRRFYDTMLTEFIIRNKLMRESGTKNFLFVSHQLRLPATFPLDYEKSFFRKVEEKDISNIEKTQISAYGIPIDSNYDIFATRYEEYYELIHDNIEVSPDMSMWLTFNIFDQELLNGIRDNKLINDSLSDIIIKYFNDIDINRHDIEALSDIDYKNNYELFFKIPIIIFIISYYIKKLMSTSITPR